MGPSFLESLRQPVVLGDEVARSLRWIAGAWEQEGLGESEQAHNESSTISASLRAEQGDIMCLLVSCNRNYAVLTFYEDFLKSASNQAFRWMVLEFGCTLEWLGELLKNRISKYWLLNDSKELLLISWVKVAWWWFSFLKMPSSVRDAYWSTE